MFRVFCCVLLATIVVSASQRNKQIVITSAWGDDLIQLREEEPEPKISRITYGKKGEGDELLHEASMDWKPVGGVPQDVGFLLAYVPETEGEDPKATITYFEADVETSSGEIEAFPFQGGIGETLIKVAVFTKSTEVFNYKLRVFGTKQ